MPGATGGDQFKSEPHLEEHGVMVRPIIDSIHPPARDSHREVPGEHDIDMGLAQGGLEGRNIAHIFNMETVAEEELLKFRAAGILVRSIEIAEGVGVNCQEEARRAPSEYWRSSSSQGGSTGRVMSR